MARKAKETKADIENKEIQETAPVEESKPGYKYPPRIHPDGNTPERLFCKRCGKENKLKEEFCPHCKAPSRWKA